VLMTWRGPARRLCVEHAATCMVDLLKEVDNFDVDCTFALGPGSYCDISLRKAAADTRPILSST